MEIETRKNNRIAVLISATLLVMDILVWWRVIAAPLARAEFHMLDVGQGDSSLFEFAGGSKMIIDAGPERKVVRAIEPFLDRLDPYIDLALITHPQLDHYGGFEYLLARYKIGAFIVNGLGSDSPAWKSLMGKIKSANIPMIRLGSGSLIKMENAEIEILSPDPSWLHSANSNDTGLVELVRMNGVDFLLTADIDSVLENYILEKNPSLRADVLKIAHHGSKKSSHPLFLATVRPKAAVIGVGSRNNYGHPSAETLDRLRVSSVGKNIFRTDLDGSITILPGKKLKIFTEARRPR